MPSSALLADRRYASTGCYARSRRSRTCPDRSLRDVYFGLLGPDASSITHRSAGGGIVQSATAAPYGAYLVVLPHGSRRHCEGRIFVCMGDSGSTSSPTLVANGAITGAGYRNAPPCRLPAQEEAAARRERARHRPEREVSCPAVGYVPLKNPGSGLTAAAAREPRHGSPRTGPALLRTPAERGRVWITVSRAATGRSPQHGPPENLLVVEFVARQPVANFDSHYEIETTTPQDPRHPGFQEACGGTFGPTQGNLRAGQHVRFTQFMNARCHGSIRVTVGYVTVNGPSAPRRCRACPARAPPFPSARPPRCCPSGGRGAPGAGSPPLPSCARAPSRRPLSCSDPWTRGRLAPTCCWPGTRPSTARTGSSREGSRRFCQTPGGTSSTASW